MDLPREIIEIIADYVLEYKLLDWIDFNKLTRFELLSNPNAIHLIDNNIIQINWPDLSQQQYIL